MHSAQRQFLLWFFLAALLPQSIAHAANKKLCDQHRRKLLRSQANLYTPPTLFESLGIKMDRYQYEEVPYIMGSLGSHQAVAVRKYYRGNLVTETITVENKLGVSFSFATNFPEWPIAPDGRLLGVSYPDTVETARSDFELHQALKNAGILGQVNARMNAVDESGPAALRAAIEDGIDFYQTAIQRRKWSPQFKQQMIDEAYQNASRSLTEITRNTTTGKVVGNFQHIRAPFGRRTTRVKGSNILLSDQVGNFGKSVRRLSGIGPSFELGATDDSSFHVADFERKLKKLGLFDQLATQEVPTEAKFYTDTRLPKTARIDREHEIVDRLGRKVIVGYGDGEVNEPAKLAIDQSEGGAAYVEILTHWIAFSLDPAFSPEYNLHNRIHITMSEYPNLYKALGYTKTGKTKQINGKTWYELRSTTPILLEKLQSFIEALNTGDTQRLEQIKKATQNITNP